MAPLRTILAPRVFSLVASLIGALGGSPSAHAKTVAYCESSGNGCFYASMPLYDQNASVFEDLFPNGNPGESKLCAPTAAAMVLSTLTFDGLSYRAGSWTARHFVYRSPEARIRALIEKMGTRESDGTRQGAEKLSQRQQDFHRASGNVDDAHFRTLNAPRIRDLIERHEVDLLAQGHYDRECRRTAGGGLSCRYERKGGHALAINGTLVEDGIRLTRFYNPWFALVQTLRIRETEDDSHARVLGIKVPFDPRPFNRKTRELSSQGGSLKIIEKIGGINTNS